MYEECVVGIYKDIEKAEAAVGLLDQSEFPTNQVSVVKARLHEDPNLAAELAQNDDALRDAAIGAGLGGILGVLTGTAVASLGGFGTIFFVGPVSALVGGSLTGAFFGAIGGCGVHTHSIKHYEQVIKENSVLVIAHGDPVALTHAKRALQASDVVEVHLHAKTGDDSPECQAT